MKKTQILAMAHRSCSRYWHDREDKYCFNEHTLLDFARKIETASAQPETGDGDTEARRLFAAVISDIAAIAERLGIDAHEGGAVPIIEAISELERQRDDLLSALEAARRLIELVVPFEGDVTRQIDKAIANAKA